MFSINLREGNLACLIESLQSKSIALVEITLSKWQKIHVLVIGLEPLALLGPDQGILTEHHQEQTIHTLESSLLDSLGIGVTLLIVHPWEEDTAIQVVLIPLDISEIPSWTQVILNDWQVDQLASHSVDHFADGST